MLQLAFVLLVSSALVAAALYPTSPANSTIFRPGMAHTSMIRWMDDGAEPPADQLGSMRIELMLADEVVKVLGREVDASRREFRTHMPWGIGPDSSDYAVVFIPPIPFLPVYSARFTISNHTFPIPPGAGVLNPTAIGSLSARRATSTVDEAYLGTSSSANPVSTFDPRAEKIGTTENGSHRMRIERSVRFKALYVLWPALVGVVLAS